LSGYIFHNGVAFARAVAAAPWGLRRAERVLGRFISSTFFSTGHLQTGGRMLNCSPLGLAILSFHVLLVF
jgi:hypothetical protein